MATTLPSNRQHVGTRPIAHAWVVCCGAALLATFGAACPCAAAESGGAITQTAAAVDAPEADADLAALQTQLAQATAARDAHELLLRSLQRAVEDLNALATVHNQVFHAYPTLQRLHRQWSDVYDQRQMLLKTLLPAHPRVQLCLAKEESLQPDLQRELQAALDAARAAQPQLNAQLADLAERVAQRTVPSEPQHEPDKRPRHATPQTPSDPADQQQHLAELEARTAALARAEQALAAAQARIAATAANHTPITPEPPHSGSRTQSQLATSVTGGLVAGGFVGLALVLVTARLIRSSAQPALTAPVPPPLPGEVIRPAATARVAERTKPSAVVEPAREQSTPTVPAAAAAITPPQEPPAPVTPTVTAPIVRPVAAPVSPAVTVPIAPPVVSPAAPVMTESIAQPMAAPVSPVVTVPISELSPSPRRPDPLPTRPSVRANRSPSRMTLKEALVRCAETAAAQGR